MSTQPKLRGKPAGVTPSEVTKLKEKWLGMAEPARDFWRSRFASSETQAALRAELKTKLKADLTRDSQLTEFRQWDEANEQRALMAGKIEERKAELLAGGMKLEEAQEVLLTEAAAYSTAARDFNLGMKVSSEILQTMAAKTKGRQEEVKIQIRKDKLSLDERHLALLEKKAAAYDRAQELLTKAKTSKGGITKETLAKIESELKLL